MSNRCRCTTTSPTRTRSSTASSISSTPRSTCRCPAATGGPRCGGERTPPAGCWRDHPWATPLLQSRLNPGPATLRHHNAFIATLRAAGFSVELTAHAFALIDSYVFGFALSENALPIHGPDSVADTAASMMHFFDAEAYPAPARVHHGARHAARLRLRRRIRVRIVRGPGRPGRVTVTRRRRLTSRSPMGRAAAAARS